MIQSNYKYALQYGSQDQRTMSKLFSGSGAWLKTTYYAGVYEKELISGGYPRDIHYIYAGDGLAAIYTTQSSNSDMYYVHKDHLGSIDKITNSSKIVIQKTSFDAWGRRRNPDNWTYSNIPSTTFSRGYTGHEHLDQFDLINMNGRMYDPILGRFLSPDNFVQNPSGSQGYNRYSYGLNNPLKFIDPSGYLLASTFWSLVDNLWNMAGKNGGAGWSAGGGYWSSDYSEYGIISGFSFYEVPRYTCSVTGKFYLIKYPNDIKNAKYKPWTWEFDPNFRERNWTINTETVWGPIYNYGSFNGGPPWREGFGDFDDAQGGGGEWFNNGMDGATNPFIGLGIKTIEDFGDDIARGFGSVGKNVNRVLGPVSNIWGGYNIVKTANNPNISNTRMAYDIAKNGIPLGLDVLVMTGVLSSNPYGWAATGIGVSMEGAELFYDKVYTPTMNTLLDYSNRFDQWFVNGGYTNFYSDQQLKTEITRVDSTLEKVLLLHAYRFKWKTNLAYNDIGLLAQEVESVFPELVFTDSLGYKQIAYHKLVPILLQAIREQDSIIEQQIVSIEKYDQQLKQQGILINDVIQRLNKIEKSK